MRTFFFLTIDIIHYYCSYTAFVSCYVCHQFGNAKAHINKHTHIKSITKKFHKKSVGSAIKNKVNKIKILFKLRLSP